MSFIHTPNLPGKPVKAVVVDGRISAGLQEGFKNLGIHMVKTEKYAFSYPAVSFHPDIIIHHLGGNNIVHAPGIAAGVLERLSLFGFNLIQGETQLAAKYPGNIAYNVARVGFRAFHNLKYTDPVLKRELARSEVTLIHVNQGYAKCSISVVDHAGIITADLGIARAAEKHGIEALVIPAEENILLPGLDRGFIGGATGMLDKKVWGIAGNIERLKSARNILDFLDRRGVEVVSLYPGPVVDIGSILPIMTE